MNMTRQTSKRVSPNLFLFLVLTEAIVEYPFNTSRVNHIIQCVSNLFEQALLRGQQDSQGLWAIILPHIINIIVKLQFMFHQIMAFDVIRVELS